MRLSKPAIAEIRSLLSSAYPSAESELEFTSPFECLIATMLSAQCTDKRVNLITAALFQEIKGPEDVVRLSVEALEDRIKSCNYYKTKARHMLAAAHSILMDYQGQVPADRELLMKLPGVGRKTANVVLSNAFGVPAIAVDTHVLRVANRLGLAQANDPLETEHQLMQVIPREEWCAAHHWLILHGRRVCHARNPSCHACALNHVCCAYRRETESQCVAGQRPEENQTNPNGHSARVGGVKEGVTNDDDAKKKTNRPGSH